MSFQYKYYSFFIWLAIHGHLDYFQILAIMKSAVMNIGMQISFLSWVFWTLGKMPSSEITVSYGSSICSLLRSIHILFQKVWRSWHSTISKWGFFPTPPFIPSLVLWSLWCVPISLVWGNISLFWLHFIDEWWIKLFYIHVR